MEKYFENLSENYLQDAFTNKTSFSYELENIVAKKAPTPYFGLNDYQKFSLRESYRAVGKTVPLDAVEMALYEKGITPNSLVKNVLISGTDILFPAYLELRLSMASVGGGLVRNFVKSFDIRPEKVIQIPELKFTAGSLRLKEMQPETTYPVIKFALSKTTITKVGYGALLQFGKDDIMNSPLDVVTPELDLIGAQVGVDETHDMFLIMANALLPAKTLSAGSATVNKAAYLKLASSISGTGVYQMDRAVSIKTNYLEIQDVLSSFTNPQAQIGMLSLNLPVVDEWNYTTVIPTKTVLGVDSRYAMRYHGSNGFGMLEKDVQSMLRTRTIEMTLYKVSAFSVMRAEAIGAIELT